MPFPQFGYHYATPQILSPGNPLTGSPVATTAPSFCDNNNSSQCLSYQKCHSTEAVQNFNRFTSAAAQVLQQASPHVPGFVSPNNSSPVLLHPLNASVYPPSALDSSDHYKSLDSQSLYPPTLTGQYVMREGLADLSSWHSVSQHPYYSYDPAAAAFAPYGYNNFDLSNSSMMRRKNATRETTGTLKNWLVEHKKNPYPSKGEKIMLAIITKMTLTQVSTWFANARRRLKKENKMTWEPRTRSTDDDEEEDDDDDDDDMSFINSSRSGSYRSDNTDLSNSPINRKEPVVEDVDSKKTAATCNGAKTQLGDSISSQVTVSMPHSSKQIFCSESQQNGFERVCSPLPGMCSIVSNISSHKDVNGLNNNRTPRETIEKKSKPPKTKIWSLADTATNNKTNFSEETSGTSTGHFLHQLPLSSCRPYAHHFSTSYHPYSISPLQTSLPHSFCHSRTMSGGRHDTLPQTPSSGLNSYHSIQMPNFIGNFSSREPFVIKESTNETFKHQKEAKVKILNDEQLN